MDRIKELLDRLAELNDEELDELRGLVSSEADTLADAPTSPEVVAQLNELADAGEAVKTEQDARQAAQEQAEADRAVAADRIAAIKGGDEDAEPEAEEDDKSKAKSKSDDEEDDDKGAEAEEASEVPEAVAASGRVRRLARRGKAPLANPEGRNADAPYGTAVVASGALRGVDPGTNLEDRGQFAEAVAATLKRMNRNGAPRGDVILASATWEYPPERTFTSDPDHNAMIVDAVTNQDALVASGGVCAPVNVDYAAPTWATAERPLKSGLAAFQATRGGLRYVKPPDQAELANATAVWTEAEDLAPGEATKPLLHIACGSEEVTYVDAIPTRLGFGNMQGQFSPEWVAANMDLAVAAAARVAENNILKHLEALAITGVTKAQGLGATRDMIGQIREIVAAYRWIHRIAPGVKLTAVFPHFVLDIIRVDLAVEQAHQQSGEWNTLEISDAQVEALIKTHDINPIFHLDGQPAKATGGAAYEYPVQGYSSTAIAAGTAIPVFPTEIVWYLFVEGSVQLLDGGRLDIGVVRDSTLDATNDYETFVEVFESVANRGFAGAVIQVKSSLKAIGTSSAAISYNTAF